MQQANLNPSPKSWLERQLDTEETTSPFFLLEKQQGVKALHIDFQFANGDRIALPCADLRKIIFSASKGITLFWLDEEIQILGRKLGMLYQYLVLHRVNTIIELPEVDTIENTLVITKLVWENEHLDGF